MLAPTMAQTVLAVSVAARTARCVGVIREITVMDLGRMLVNAAQAPAADAIASPTAVTPPIKSSANAQMPAAPPSEVHSVNVTDLNSVIAVPSPATARIVATFSQHAR